MFFSEFKDELQSTFVFGTLSENPKFLYNTIMVSSPTCSSKWCTCDRKDRDATYFFLWSLNKNSSVIKLFALMIETQARRKSHNELK